MHFFFARKLLVILLILAVLIVALVVWQVVYITHHYTAMVPVPDIPRGTERFGHGPLLKLIVLGDSTSIGQGAEYEQGIARQSAQLLAKDHTVELTNVGISGARVVDVLRLQLRQTVALQADVALIAIGANDVTHLTPLGSVHKNLLKMIGDLRDRNPRIQIVLTGSPAMGAVPRFAPPTQWLAAWRVRRINAVFAAVAKHTHTTLVPLARETGPIFRRNPSLFAADNFHPTADGYAVWQPVIDAGLAEASQETGHDS